MILQSKTSLAYQLLDLIKGAGVTLEGVVHLWQTIKRLDPRHAELQILSVAWRHVRGSRGSQI